MSTSSSNAASPGDPNTGESISRARFRDEVIAERSNQWLGKLTLARPLSFAIYSTAAFCLTSCIIAFLAFGSYAKTESVSAVIAPENGPTEVSSAVAGTVSEVFVHEGDRVSKGTPLFRVQVAKDQAAADGKAGRSSDMTAVNAESFETVKAPVSGRIYRLAAKTGGTVSAYDREPIATIAADDALIIEAKVMSAVQAAVNTGEFVQVELDAFKGRKKANLTALVVAVAAEPAEDFDLMSGGTKRSYKVVMRIDTSDSNIPSDELLGKTVQVKFLLEKRKLYEWLIDPLKTLFGN
jgi:multidrug resistance efflux pump